MEKKYLIVLFGIVIILIIFGLFFINNYVNLDGTFFKSIDGYKANYGDEFINFTDDKNFILIKTSNDTINNSVNSYLKTEDSLNVTYKSSNFSLGGLKVYKVTLDKYPVVHFWFEKNNKVFEIYTWNNDETTDLKVFNLIKSSFP